jgi:hypothetical protein
MKNSIDTYKEAIDKQVSIISYTMNMIDVFGNIPTEVANSSSIDHLGNLFTSFKEAGKTEYSEFIYNGIIVSVYGAFERLVENIIEAYLNSISKKSKLFDKLPNAIQKKHTELSLTLALKVGKDRNITNEEKLKSQENIVNNLSGCMGSSAEIKLNVCAFSSHTANFRLDIVRESFSNIGLTTLIDDIQNNLRLINFVKSEKGYTESDILNKTVFFNEIKFKLDDLANRRNEIAHGSRPQGYLSYTLLLSLCDFMGVLGDAIYECCLSNDKSIELNNINLHDSNSYLIDSPIICVDYNAIGFKVVDSNNLNGCNLNLGTKIYITNNAEKIIHETRITSLIVNKISTDAHEITQPFEFGIQIDIPLQNNFSDKKFFFYNDRSLTMGDINYP